MLPLVSLVALTTSFTLSSAHDLFSRDDTCSCFSPGATNFANSDAVKNAISQASTPAGYVNTGSNGQAWTPGQGSLGFVDVDDYDSSICAGLCDAIRECNSFQIYFEPGKDSKAQPKCAFWGGVVDSSKVNYNISNAIAGVNTYSSSKVVPPSGYDAPKWYGDSAYDYSSPDVSGSYIGSHVFTDGSYDTSRCADKVDSLGGSFYNTYLLHDDKGSAQHCDVYSEEPRGTPSWSGKSGSNSDSSISNSFTCGKPGNKDGSKDDDKPSNGGSWYNWGPAGSSSSSGKPSGKPTDKPAGGNPSFTFSNKPTDGKGPYTYSPKTTTSSGTTSSETSSTTYSHPTGPWSSTSTTTTEVDSTTSSTTSQETSTTSTASDSSTTSTISTTSTASGATTSSTTSESSAMSTTSVTTSTTTKSHPTGPPTGPSTGHSPEFYIKVSHAGNGKRDDTFIGFAAGSDEAILVSSNPALFYFDSEKFLKTGNAYIATDSVPGHTVFKRITEKPANKPSITVSQNGLSINGAGYCSTDSAVYFTYGSSPAGCNAVTFAVTKGTSPSGTTTTTHGVVSPTTASSTMSHGDPPIGHPIDSTATTSHGFPGAGYPFPSTSTTTSVAAPSVTSSTTTSSAGLPTTSSTTTTTSSHDGPQFPATSSTTTTESSVVNIAVTTSTTTSEVDPTIPTSSTTTTSWEAATTTTTTTYGEVMTSSTTSTTAVVEDTTSSTTSTTAAEEIATSSTTTTSDAQEGVTTSTTTSAIVEVVGTTSTTSATNEYTTTTTTSDAATSSTTSEEVATTTTSSATDAGYPMTSSTTTTSEDPSSTTTSDIETSSTTSDADTTVATTTTTDAATSYTTSTVSASTTSAPGGGFPGGFPGFDFGSPFTFGFDLGSFNFGSFSGFGKRGSSMVYMKVINGDTLTLTTNQTDSSSMVINSDGYLVADTQYYIGVPDGDAGGLKVYTKLQCDTDKICQTWAMQGSAITFANEAFVNTNGYAQFYVSATEVVVKGKAVPDGYKPASAVAAGGASTTTSTTTSAAATSSSTSAVTSSSSSTSSSTVSSTTSSTVTSSSSTTSTSSATSSTTSSTTTTSAASSSTSSTSSTSTSATTSSSTAVSTTSSSTTSSSSTTTTAVSSSSTTTSTGAPSAAPTTGGNGNSTAPATNGTSPVDPGRAGAGGNATIPSFNATIPTFNGTFPSMNGTNSTGAGNVTDWTTWNLNTTSQFIDSYKVAAVISSYSLTDFCSTLLGYTTPVVTSTVTAIATATATATITDGVLTSGTTETYTTLPTTITIAQADPNWQRLRKRDVQANITTPAALATFNADSVTTACGWMAHAVNTTATVYATTTSTTTTTVILTVPSETVPAATETLTAWSTSTVNTCEPTAPVQLIKNPSFECYTAGWDIGVGYTGGQLYWGPPGVPDSEVDSAAQSYISSVAASQNASDGSTAAGAGAGQGASSFPGASAAGQGSAAGAPSGSRKDRRVRRQAIDIAQEYAQNPSLWTPAEPAYDGTTYARLSPAWNPTGDSSGIGQNVDGLVPGNYWMAYKYRVPTYALNDPDCTLTVFINGMPVQGPSTPDIGMESDGWQRAGGFFTVPEGSQNPAYLWIDFWCPPIDPNAAASRSKRQDPGAAGGAGNFNFTQAAGLAAEASLPTADNWVAPDPTIPLVDIDYIRMGRDDGGWAQYRGAAPAEGDANAAAVSADVANSPAVAAQNVQSGVPNFGVGAGAQGQGQSQGAPSGQ